MGKEEAMPAQTEFLPVRHPAPHFVNYDTFLFKDYRELSCLVLVFQIDAA